jgi:hypothetical protein
MTITFGASSDDYMRPGPARLPGASLSSHLEIKPIGLAKLPGSFVSPQAIYADEQRIYACSYQGDLFILERERRRNFPWVQSIHFNTPLTAVHGDEDHLYVTGRDGNLYVLAKTWPVRLLKSISLSNYGLASVQAIGKNVYVALGQASMTVSDRYLYLSPLNPGDLALEVSSGRNYCVEPFEPGKTYVFDRQNSKLIGTIPNRHSEAVRVSAWQNFVYLTVPGCCGAGIDILDADTFERVQFVSRSANAVAAIRRNDMSVLVGGSERGSVDWYMLSGEDYQFAGSLNLRALTGFTGPEDIEIRSLWIDGLDNLFFAGSSWGNDQTRSTELPSFFFFEIVY